MERLREAGRLRMDWMDWTAGPVLEGSREHPDPPGRQDPLVRLAFLDRMVSMGKLDLPAHVDLPGRRAPKVWPVLPALTVTTETKVRLAHRGLAVFRVRQVLRGQMAARESPAQTDLTGKTDGPVRWVWLVSLAQQGEQVRPAWMVWMVWTATADMLRRQHQALGFWPLRRRTANF